MAGLGVLIVESDSGLRDAMKDQLLGHGLQVTVVDGLASANDEMERSSPAVVIVELGLPEGSGLALLDDRRRLGSDAHGIGLGR